MRRMPCSFRYSTRARSGVRARARTTPVACHSCVYLESCQGGCAGRRRLQNALYQPDFYCPMVRGETQKLEIRMAPARDLPKGESACTTIVIARD